MKSSLRAALAAALTLVATCAATSVARAQDDDGEQPVLGKGKYESPQNFAFELRFGPYSPKVDDNTFAPVYDNFFGDGTRFMFGLEVDWQAYRIPYVGTIGAGLGWGYTQITANNLVLENSGVDPSDVSQQSSLNIMPFYGVAVLRVDTFARNFHVPLVPYGKLGVSYALWWVNDGIGTATNDAGTKGRDLSAGTQAAVGAMFLLDILEPGAARAADVDAGVNNSYLFFEWSMSNYPGNQMNVGSNNWVTGLAFEI